MAEAARRARPDDTAPKWRLFQLAFVLLNLAGTSDPRHEDRDRVELLFFPTGGGKTEAYLGVAACVLALRQDLYWRGFVHRGQIEDGVDKPHYCHVDEDKGRLATDKGERYTSDLAILSSGTSGELSDLYVLCRRCGATRSLQDLRQPNALGDCKAWRPWLPHNDEGCEERLKLLIRTGSNVWFPQRLSVLSIPDFSNRLKTLASRRWDTLQDVETPRSARSTAPTDPRTADAARVRPATAAC